MTTQTQKDQWSSDEFEDAVAACLIACYETNVKKNKGAAPADRLTDERVAVIRAEGPYFPSNSRILIGPEEADRFWGFDLVNDKLPQKGLIVTKPGKLTAQSNPEAYLVGQHIRQVTSLGKHWQNVKHGTLYEMLNLFAENDGIAGERRFFTVTKTGDVVPCQQHIPNFSRSSEFGGRVSNLSHDKKWMNETSTWASMALQLLADKQHCWTITAQEKTAKAHLGAMPEEIKSLLYARSLPMSATGRKRPILHLVEAHKRRVKNGIDIDVTAFLRGVRVVEFGGTAFKVNPPPVLLPTLSDKSRAKYAQQA